MAAVVPSSLTASAGVPFGGDEQPPTPRVTLTRSEKNSPSPSSISHMFDRNSPAEYTRERSEPLSISSPSVELSVTSSGSDLSISLTESDLAEVPKVPGNVVYVDGHSRRTHPTRPTRGVLHPGRVISTASAYTVKKHLTLQSLGTDLNQVDNPRLQKYHRRDNKPVFLPHDAVCLHPCPPLCSSCLPPDAAPLWDRWFKHALLLKDHHVLTTKRLVQLFTPLLL
ncbi:unnamed protein product [Coregonus sp. 'balchen']|nr:unnamed protein product [Coregonus sp. 'balchen']